MDLKTKLKNFLEKLRGLQDKQKKIILWTIVGILAVIMGIFWLKGTLYRLENIGEINLNLPKFGTPETEDVIQNFENNSENSETKEEIESQINVLQEKLNQLEENN